MLSRTTKFILLILMGVWGFPKHSTAQTTFTWTAGNGSWSDTANWTVSGNGSGYPDASDDSVYFTQNTTTIDIGMPNDSSAVAGTITMNGTGVVRLGNATTFEGSLTLQAGSGQTPLIEVNGTRLAILTELKGSQGFRKTGNGTLNFNTNPLDMGNLSGNVSIEGGTVWFNQAGNFGSGNLSFSGSNTLFQHRGNFTTTFAANRTITVAGGSNINFWNQAALSGMVIDGAIVGSGNLTLTNGNFTLNGVNTHSGSTTVAGSGSTAIVNLTLGANSNLSSGPVYFTSLGTATIDLGGNVQSIQNLITESTNAGSSLTISNGELEISGGGDISLGGRGGTFTMSIAGLNSFTAGSASSNFTFQSGNTTGTTTNTLILSTNGTNTITGQTVLFGRTASGGSSTGTAYSANVNLGSINIIQADIFKVGSTNSTAAIAFQAGLSNPTLTLRSANGTSAVSEWIIGEQREASGGRSALGTVDLQGGTIDVLVGNLTVGQNSNSTASTTSWLKFSAGNLTADTIRLANKSGTSVGALSGTIYQSGGNTTIDLLEFGRSDVGNSTITAIYDLSGGRLEVGDIQVGGGNFTNTSNRTLLMSGNATLSNRNGSDLTVTGATSATGGLMRININGNATFLASGGDIILGSNSSLSGSGHLTKNGSGNLILSGTSSLTGIMTINQGGLSLGANQSLGTLAGSGSISLSSYNLTTNSSSSTTFSGVISGLGGFSKNGSGTLTLSGENSYTGNTSVNTGTLVIGSAGRLGGGSYSGNISNNGTLIYSGTSNQTLSGIISGTGVLTHNASSRLTISGNNSYTGNTSIVTGTVEIGSAGRLGVGSYSGNISNNGALIYSGTNNQTLSGIISGTGVLTQNASSRLTISGNNSYTGNTSINSGTVEIGSAGRLGGGSYSGNISNNGALIYSGTNNQTLSGIISGTGVLTHNASSRLTLSGNNSYSGNTTINTGAFEITATGLLGSGNYTAHIANSGSLIVGTNSNQTLGGVLSGNGSLTKNGTGTLTLSGNNNYTGTTSINTGKVVIGNANGLGSGGNITLNGGAIQYGAGITTDISSRIKNSGGAILIDTNSNNVTFSNAIDSSNSGGFTKNGSGTLTLSGNNAYSGGTTINTGTFVIGHVNAAGSGTITQSSGASQLKIDTTGTITNVMSVYNVLATQTATLSGAITVNNAIWDVETGATVTLSNTVSGSGGITKNGNGTLVLSGNNSYTAGTTVNSGTLESAHANSLGSNNTVEINGGSLLVSADGAIDGKQIEMSANTIGLKISGNYNGSVGRLTLSANSTIDLGSGSVKLSFHEVFMGIYYLNFYNWTGTPLSEGGTGADPDQVYLGTAGGGNYDLSHVRFYSGTTNDSFLGTGFDLGFDPGFAADHIIPVPEPETWATGGLLLLIGSFWMWKKSVPMKKMQKKTGQPSFCRCRR